MLASLANQCHGRSDLTNPSTPTLKKKHRLEFKKKYEKLTIYGSCPY
jgi:hypothetical protein